MLILDTNHYSEIIERRPIGLRLQERLQDSHQDAFLTIITPEESLKGWLAAIQPHRQSDLGVRAYREFQDSLATLSDWIILPWTHDAARAFQTLRTQGVRIGFMDLRIASIAFEYEATVLTRNLRHFCQVPGLKVENWLD